MALGVVDGKLRGLCNTSEVFADKASCADQLSDGMVLFATLLLLRYDDPCIMPGRVSDNIGIVCIELAIFDVEVFPVMGRIRHEDGVGGMIDGDLTVVVDGDEMRRR